MGNLVWHYTSVNNGVSIIASGELWAHRASEMNDEREVTYALDRTRFFALEEFPSHLDGATRTLIDEALSLDAPTVHQKEVFLLSASKNGDSAYQWRHYAGPDGMAIGIDVAPRVLAERDKSGFAPLVGWYPVAYDKDDQRLLVQNTADRLQQVLRLGAQFPEHDVWSRYADMSPREVLGLLSPLTCTLKCPDWSKEQEYRYIDRLETGVRPARRDTENGLRYFTKVVPDSGALPIRQVRIGPCAKEPQRDEVRKCLRTHGFEDVPVDRSTAVLPCAPTLPVD